MTSILRWPRSWPSCLRLATTVVLVTGCVPVPAHPVQSPLGAPVEVIGAQGSIMQGELLAVSEDSLWLLRTQAEGGALAAVSLRQTRAVRVRHGTRPLPRTALTGLALGTALSALVPLGAWATKGQLIVSFGLFGLIIGVERGPLATDEVTPPTPAMLAKWARFPQGFPSSVPDSLPSRR